MPRSVPPSTSAVGDTTFRDHFFPRTQAPTRASAVLTACTPRSIPMSDNSIARTPNSRVAPGGGGPTRTFSEVRGVNR
jgi:hypothetical protein